jgi:hypothetical protein
MTTMTNRRIEPRERQAEPPCCRAATVEAKVSPAGRRFQRSNLPQSPGLIGELIGHVVARFWGEMTMGKPTVIVVGADKGGVGKTTVARTLLDYFVAHQVPIRAFDSEAPKGTLKRFHPDISKVVDITAVPDQMHIFDTVSDTRVTIIDVRAGLLSPTLRALRDVGFLESVKKEQLEFVVFHILGSSIASLNEIEDTSAFTRDASYFLVKNFINNTSFFEWDQATHSSYFKKVKNAVEITIPKLNEMAYEQVELASVPFLSFVANKGPKGDSASYSFILRGYVRHWLGNVWGEYDRIKLNDIVASTPLANDSSSAWVQLVRA